MNSWLHSGLLHYLAFFYLMLANLIRTFQQS